MPDHVIMHVFILFCLSSTKFEWHAQAYISKKKREREKSKKIVITTTVAAAFPRSSKIETKKNGEEYTNENKSFTTTSIPLR